MQWDRDRGVEDQRGLGGPIGGEREVGAVEAARQLDRAGEEQRDVDGSAARGDLADDVERGVVAGDIDRRQVVRGQPEADDRAGDLLAARRPVQRRERGDRHGTDGRGLPWLQAGRAGVGAKALGARGRREHVRDAVQQVAPGGIEIVGVVVVGDERDIDGTELVGCDGRARRLDEAAGMLAGCGERRVRQPTQAAVLEDHGRPADEANVEAGH